MGILDKVAVTLKETLQPLDVIQHPSEENLEWVIQNYLPQLKPDDYFQRVVAYDRYLHDVNLSEDERERKFYYADIVPTMIVNLGMQNNLRARMARGIISKWYESGIMEQKLNDYNTILRVLARRPDLAHYVATRESIQYIQFLSSRMLRFFWLYAYRLNGYHKDCGGRIEYGLVEDAALHRNMWEWYCNQCRKSLDDTQLNDDVQLRK